MTNNSYYIYYRLKYDLHSREISRICAKYSHIDEHKWQMLTFNSGSIPMHTSSTAADMGDDRTE